MIPGAPLVAEGCLRQVRVPEEVGDHLVEGAGEVEEASYHQEEGVQEESSCLQNLAPVEVAQGRRGGRVQEEDLREQQLLPASAGRVHKHQGGSGWGHDLKFHSWHLTHKHPPTAVRY